MAPKEVIPGITRTNVARVAVDSIPEEAFAGAVEHMLSDEDYHHFVFLRTWDLLRARRDARFRQYVRNSALSIPASPTLIRAARFLRRPQLYFYTPFDFVVRLLGVLEERGRSVYLLGGDKFQLHKVEQNIKLTFPGLRIVGRYTGYYPEEFERNIVTAIKKSAPDFLLVGPGIPGHDLWIFTHRKLFNPGTAVASSEVFDIFGDRKKRSARTPGKRTLEAIKTVIQKPWRILRAPLYLWFALVLLATRARGN